MTLLKKGASLLKKDGILVYSTCTIEHEENYDIVSEFLNENIDYKLIKANDLFDDKLLDANGCVQTFPHTHQMDGVFAAKIQKIK